MEYGGSRIRFLISPILQLPAPPSSGPALAAFHEPCDPDAAFIKQHHRQTHSDKSNDVWCGRDDSGENENQDDGVGPRPRHEFIRDQPKANEYQYHHRQFKSESETKSETRDKRIVLLHRPSRRPPERLRIVKKEKNRFWEEPEVTNQHASYEKKEADGDRREQHFFLHHGERRENKFGGKK